MKYWLMKSEPDCFSIDDLKRVKREPWDGVRNYQVRNMFRDEMAVGDKAIFYHSNAKKETGAVGVMTIASKAYPDPTQFDPKSDHPDPKSDLDNPRWLLVDVAYESHFKYPVLLSEMRLDPKLDGLPLLAKGNRLSVMPISKKHFEYICKHGS
ncbi:MAG TPA: EVE domain-containing protein [Candidatus Paceibacterota bacterium]|nr:EVE domain-containing protein [Candidatus Paceibacterota bacterium]